MDTDYRYKAFISYSHRDKAVAKWLHRALETYSVPRHLVGRETLSGPVPDSLRPVFRDQSELAVSPSLTDSVTHALSGSEFLIVICSPSSAASAWVQQEILTFKREHGESRVLALIASGEPFASNTADAADEECFPSALRHALAADGTESTVRLELMAADIRPGHGGKRLAVLKLVAAMLRVDLDELVQRDTQRRYRRLKAIAAAAVAGMLIMGWLTITAIQARSEAEAQRNSAEALIEFMLGDLRDKLEPVGRLDALDSVGEKALEYYALQDEGSLDADSLGRRSRALHLIGEIADTRGDTEGALRSFQRAAESTAALLDRDSADTQRIYDHSQSVFWVGYVAFQRGEYDTAEKAFTDYLDLATKLVKADPTNQPWQMELGYANGNLGALAFEQERWADAEAAYLRALSITRSLVAEQPENTDLLFEVANNHSWLSSVYLNMRRFADGAEQNRAEIGVFEDLLQRDAKNRGAQLRQLIAMRGMAQFELAMGGLEAAMTNLYRAERIARDLVDLEPDSTVYAEQLVALLRDKAEIDHLRGQADPAQEALREAIATTGKLIEQDETVMFWQVDLLMYSQLRQAKILFDARALNDARAVLNEIFARLANLAAAGADVHELPFVSGSAHLLDGDIRASNGDPGEADAAWREARSALDGDRAALDPRRLTTLIMALSRLGQAEEAASIVVSLYDSGYRHPTFMRIRDQVR